MGAYPTTIYVASPETKINYLWEKASNRLSKSLEIKTVEELENLPTIERNKFSVDNFEEGMVLIYNRIDDCYLKLSENIHQKFEDSKDRAIDYIVSLLGARKITRSVERVDCEKRILEVDGSLGYSVSDLEVKTKFSTEKRNSLAYNCTKDYAGKYSHDGYQKALDYCKSTGLIADPGIRDILRARDPQHPNPILRYTSHVSLASECEDAMDAAFSLNVLGGVFKLSASIKEVLSQKKSLTLSLDIEYSPI